MSDYLVEEGIDISNAIVSSKSGRVYDTVDLSSLLCNHCNFIARDVHQLLGCGHRYCKKCVYVAIGSDQKCPKGQVDCHEVVTDDDIRPDKACHRELAMLLAKCKGCQKWEGLLLDIEEHYENCMEIEVSCANGCQEKIIRKNFLDHNKICTYRIVACKYCNQEIRSYQMEEHISMCGSVPVPCEKCNVEVIREKLKEHQSSWCRENIVQCTFENCSFKGKVFDMRIHYKSHLHELFKVLQMSGQQKKILMTRLKKAVEELDELHRKTKLCSKQMNKMKDNLLLVEDLTDKITQLQNEISATNKRIGQNTTQVDSGGQKMPFMDDSELRTLSNRILKLEQDVLVMKPSIEEIQQTSQSFHDQIVGYVEVVQTIKEAISRHTVSMDEVRLRQDILDVKTVNGVFVWKIPEVSRRHREAKEKRTLSLYSPPFHTSPHGYRMCIRSYLNGDGSGKDVYISVFFVLMKSEHDDMLAWPFRRPVTFELVSQVSKVKSISETFMPDEISPSFQKPKAEMNVASGFPKFAKQSLLKDNAFVKDDAIFIRCKVDVSVLQCE